MNNFGSVSFDDRPTRGLTSQGVTELLRQIRTQASTENPEILGINIVAQMRARNNGFPKFLYHPELEAVQVMSRKEEEALFKVGFVDQYIKKDYPRMLYRRNLADRWAEHDYVEHRIAQDAESEAQMLREPGTTQRGKWCAKVTDIEPLLTEETEQDLRSEIERLRGRLEERKAMAATAEPTEEPVRRGPGRPRKIEQEPAE